MKRAATLLVIGLLAAGCSDDDDAADDAGTATATSVAAGEAPTAPTGAPGSSAPAPGTAGSSTNAPTGTAAATQPGTGPTTPAPTSPPTPPPVFGEPVVAGQLVAELSQPIGMATRPGDAALYVIEQDGLVVQVLPSDEGDAQVVEVADVSDRTNGNDEQGLLGIAFATDGALAWLNYTDNNGDTVVAEYPVAADGTFDVGAERVLLTIGQPYPNHNGGDLVVGPDGMLYIAMGDGGSGGDPERRASDATNLLGKLLRIDPTPSGDAAYSIPADNPFASGSMGDVAGAAEVWSWGLRNPWKVAFDPVTAELWIADVGQNAIEEVNVVGPTDENPAGWGVDFGWSAFEGNNRYNDDVPDPGNLVFPVWTYGHSTGCSISGGAVYRGAAIPGLAPAYVYGDYCTGAVWAFDAASGTNVELLDGFAGIAAVRAGPDGELYVIDQAGAVTKLIPG